MNDTCRIVSNHTRKKLNKNNEYEAGEVLICRDQLNPKKIGIFKVNFEYEFLNISDETFSIECLLTGEVYQIPKDIIKKSFIFDYCATCHSTQGQTIDEKSNYLRLEILL